MYMYAYYIHTVDIYMTAVLMFMLIFNVYITDLACFDGYARAATLITDRLRTGYG